MMLKNVQGFDVSIAPRIYYEVISSCNLSCEHCNDAFSASARRIAPEALLAFHASFADAFGHGGRISSVVTGGEPTLHTDLGTILEGLARYGPVVVTTNGTLQKTEFFCEMLSALPNLALQVSIDGATKKTFESIRGVGTWEPVRDFVEGITGAGFADRLCLSMTPMRLNYKEMDGVIAMAEILGVGMVYFPSFLPAGNALESWDSIAMSASETIQFLDTLGNKIATPPRGTRIASNAIDQVLTRLQCGEHGDCLSSFTLKVDCDGAILPCPATGRKDASVGNISAPDVIQQLPVKLDESRTKWLSMIAPPADRCVGCEAHAFCRGHFCASCHLLAPPKPSIVNEMCTVLQHHFHDAQKAKSELVSEYTSKNLCERGAG